MVEPVTPSAALQTIATLVGGAGISGILIAFIGYATAARQGRRGEPERAGKGITALLSDSGSIDNLALSIDRLALAADKFALLSIETKHEVVVKFNDLIDEMIKLRRAAEDIAANNDR